MNLICSSTMKMPAQGEFSTRLAAMDRTLPTSSVGPEIRSCQQAQIPNDSAGEVYGAALSLGIAPFVISQLCWFLPEYQRDCFGVAAPTSVVEDISGSIAEDFMIIARRYIEDCRRIERGALLASREKYPEWLERLWRPRQIFGESKSNTVCKTRQISCLQSNRQAGNPPALARKGEILRDVPERLEDQCVFNVVDIGIVDARQRHRSGVRFLTEHRVRPPDHR
jgi:hypothetical protein